MRRRTNVVNNDEAPRLAQSDRRCKTGQRDELFDGSLPARGRFENAERHAATSGDRALFGQTITPVLGWTPPKPRRPDQRRRFSVRPPIMIDVTWSAASASVSVAPGRSSHDLGGRALVTNTPAEQ